MKQAFLVIVEADALAGQLVDPRSGYRTVVVPQDFPCSHPDSGRLMDASQILDAPQFY
jgi:hypothetical protein